MYLGVGVGGEGGNVRLTMMQTSPRRKSTELPNAPQEPQALFPDRCSVPSVPVAGSWYHRRDSDLEAGLATPGHF